jgi:tetratricopeptide (TPR) repeat protein
VIPVAPLLADVNGDRKDEIFLCLETGDFRALTFNPAENPPVRLLYPSLKLASPPASAPILVQAGTDINSSRIIQATKGGLYAINPASGAVVASEIQSFQGDKTSLALLPNGAKYPDLAFGMSKSLLVTRNMHEWISGGGTSRIVADNGELRNNLSEKFSPISVLSPEGDLFVLGVSSLSDGQLYGFKIGRTAGMEGWPTRTPWATLNSTPLRNSLLDRDAARLERTRRAKAAEVVTKWRTELDAAAGEGNWDRATELARELAQHDPFNGEFRALQRNVWIKSNLIGLIAGILAGLAAIGYATYLVVSTVISSRIRSRAESSFARGEHDTAREAYQQLLARTPRNAKATVALAKVCVAQRDYSEATLSIYQRGHEAAPDDQEILHSYVRALLLEPKVTAEAGRVYEKALSGFPEPALIEYGLGRVALQAGNFEEAGKRLRSALRGGMTTDALYRALTDTYMRTGNYTAKALPVFEQQYPSRMDDREFLQAFVLVCIDAKKADAQVESLCQAVLDFTPEFIPAYLHLAGILLQKNQTGAAIQEVKQALEVAPNDERAIALLAQCYLVQSRKDEEALATFRRALRIAPEDRELLKQMSAILFERGVYDEESVEIYHRSLEANPGDINTLRALAQTAQLSNNADLSIRSVEALMHSGQANQKLVNQLADAYVRKQVAEPKAERVFREALRLEPNNVEYLQALARLLVSLDRTDADCIATYENHLRNYKSDVAVARVLAKSYIKADRYETALATTQKFLQIAPQDEELLRLNALASLYDNKIDEAVSEYQRILQRNPSDPEATVNLALAYGQKQRTDEEATSLYERALRLQPQNERLHLAKARVAVVRNDAVAAADAYKAALKAREGSEPLVVNHLQALLAEHPDVLRLRWFLVELQVSLGHLREALEQLEFITKNHPGQTTNVLRALESILAKDPNNLTALMQRGSLLLTNQQFDDAVRMLEKAWQLRPNDPVVVERLAQAFNALLEKKDSTDIRFKLGKLHYSQQEFDKAIGCFQRTSQDYRWEAESNKMLGKCFSGKGMLDLALQEFKKLVVDEETKELLYDLAQRYEAKRDLVGAKTVYRQLFAADINYKDVQNRFEMLSGSTSDPMAFEKTSIVQQMSEEAARRYELLDELGRGAMGIVYRARDKELEEVVALKILPDNMSNNPEAVRRFKIEARNARKMSHPHIVRIHDIGEEMGRKYISMEYVDGSDLKKVIKTAPNFKVPLKDVLKYSTQVGEALAYAHRVGVVHRDIKPANIMLTSGDDVKVTDFGIAKLMDGAGEGTMIGAVIGTPLYMSPEQVQGIPVDNRADIYSYGIMFYELLNGRPPFTEGDLAYLHIHREPPKIEGINEDLWAIVAKCLAKKKEDRWENAEQIVEALKQFAKANPA